MTVQTSKVIGFLLLIWCTSLIWDYSSNLVLNFNKVGGHVRDRKESKNSYTSYKATTLHLFVKLSTPAHIFQTPGLYCVLSFDRFVVFKLRQLWWHHLGHFGSLYKGSRQTTEDIRHTGCAVLPVTSKLILKCVKSEIWKTFTLQSCCTVSLRFRGGFTFMEAKSLHRYPIKNKKLYGI